MNQAGVKRTMVYTATGVVAFMGAGAITASALALASTETATSSLLADTIIKLVNMFVKLVLFIA